MLVAAEHPERVTALVLVAPATPETPIAWAERALRTPVLGEIAMALANRPMVAFGLRHRLFAGAGRVTEQAIDDAWFPLTVPGTRRAALAAIRSDPRPYLGLEARVRAPTLIVWGREDRLIPVERRRTAPGAHSRLEAHCPSRRRPPFPARAARSLLTRRRAVPRGRGAAVSVSGPGPARATGVARAGHRSSRRSTGRNLPGVAGWCNPRLAASGTARVWAWDSRHDRHCHQPRSRRSRRCSRRPRSSGSPGLREEVLQDVFS